MKPLLSLLPLLLVFPSTALAAGEDGDLGIVGGEPSGSCAFPSVVSVGGVCTGTLIAPQVVVTAAHCGDPQFVEFGDTTGTGLIVGSQCFDVPGEGRGADVQFCILDFPVRSVPSTPILYGCELGLLDVDLPVTIVGYGLTSFGAQNSSGTKRSTTTTVRGFLAEGSALIGTPERSPCPGDSGGPALVEMPDGSWRTFGVVSGGTTGTPCNGDAAYPLIHRYVPWFEAASGIDITPCHDADGTWNPGPDCGGFYSGTEDGGPSWETICAGTPIVGASETCGTNPLAKADMPSASQPVEGEFDSAAGCAAAPGTGGSALVVFALSLLAIRRRR